MIVIDPAPDPIPHRLVRLTGAVRQWTCQSQHQIIVGSQPFAVRRHRFIAWLPLVPGWQDITLSVDCCRCQLHDRRTLRLCCRPAGGLCRVQPTLLVCADDDGSVFAPAGEDGSRAGAARRLWIGCLLLQALFSDKLREHFPGRPARTFALCDTVLTQRLRLTRAEALRMGPRQLWRRAALELRDANLDLATTKVLAFLTCAEPDAGDGGDSGAGGHVWQGGGGLALCSAACLFSWPRSVAEIGPRFGDERAAPPGADTSGRGSRWACLSTTLGAAGHELGHALDLGHATHGLMGRAYDELWRYCVLEPADGGGAIRRPPPGLPAVPGVPAGHRCDADCHARAVARCPATSDLTFLDAASAALLYHHAWCAPGEGEDAVAADSAIHISPDLQVVSAQPLRVVVCRTADEDARPVGFRALDEEDHQLELGQWVRDAVAEFRGSLPADNTRKASGVSQRKLSDTFREKPAGQLSEAGKDSELRNWEAGSELRHADLDGGLLSASSDICLADCGDDFIVLVENEAGGIAKRTHRL